MMNKPLENLIRRSQIDANRERRSIAILNLNPYSGLYVARYWQDSFAKSPELLRRIDPEQPR
jgi:hypothetical protein